MANLAAKQPLHPAAAVRDRRLVRDGNAALFFANHSTLEIGRGFSRTFDGDTSVGEIDRLSKAGPDEPVNPAQVIARACEAISSADVATAASIIASDYPHTLLKRERRRKTIPAAVMIKVFLRDRFVDRYTGQQLIFGPALHLLSQIYCPTHSRQHKIGRCREPTADFTTCSRPLTS